MKKKIIILGLVLLAILCSCMFLVYADTGRQVKTILRKSLFEYFQHPIKTTLNRSEVIDLLEAYLEEEDISNVDFEAARSHSGKSIRSIVNKAINHYGTEPECVDQCGDGECAAIVCTGIGCPCWETSESCPEDCGDECTVDEDCGEGKVCTNGECEAAGEPSECSPAGTTVCSEDGNFLKTCIVDPGNIGRLIWSTETCPNGCENGACKELNLVWDIDDNKIVEQDDSNLTLRYLFGFRGDALIQGSIGENAQRTTATQIEAYLSCLEGLDILDVDGNGKSDALTDGLLIQRYISGYSGQQLIDGGAIASDATRTSAEEIITFLENPDGWSGGACGTMAPSTCGDGVIDDEEQCDGDELGGKTCLNVSQYFIGGSLSCSSYCRFDTSLCERDNNTNWGNI